MKEQLSKDTIQNHKKALRILSTAQKEDWPFFRTFIELKTLHLNRYKVDVTKGDMTFFWHDGAETFLKSEETSLRKTGKEFNPQGIKNAIEHSKKKIISYQQFLERISDAGCSLYQVNFETDQIIYYGINENNKVVEKVQAN